jgi:hypothetical protein
LVIPRRVAFLGIAALVLAGAGIAAAATYSDDDDTPAALEQPATTTSMLLPETTTTTALATTTTALASTTTTAGTGRTTTTRAGATTTTTRAGGTTTTTGPVGACATAQVQAAVTTDKPSYGIGEPVRIHSTLHNRSGSTCTYPSFVFTATILSPAGATVTSFTRQGDQAGALGSGQAHEAFVTWERVSCTSDICPPNVTGDYTVSATWNFPGGPHTATRTFRLT